MSRTQKKESLECNTSDIYLHNPFIGTHEIEQRSYIKCVYLNIIAIPPTI